MPKRRRGSGDDTDHEHTTPDHDSFQGAASLTPQRRADYVLALVAHYLKADLDAGHQAELARQRQTVIDKISSRKTVPDISHQSLQSSAHAVDSIKTAEKKVKAKSRPTEQKEVLEETAPDCTEKPTEASDITTPPTIPSTKRALAVFTRMFNPDISESGQTVDWDQFIHAMKDVGFSARNSAGSAVIFELSEKGKIIFHRPHPIAKIDSVMLKAMGKRMRKWFGWARESFVEAVG